MPQRDRGAAPQGPAVIVKVRSIVTTPNPNHMRFDLTEAPKATQGTYDDAGAEDCPAFARDLLCIPGVRSLYLCGEWFSLRRSPKAEWFATGCRRSALAIAIGHVVAAAATNS